MNKKQSKDMSFENFPQFYESGFGERGSRKFYNLILREITLQPGYAVLDVGCGTGALLKKISTICEIDGYGIDAEQNMIATAAKNCPEMRFAEGVCDKLPFDEDFFDVVIACMAYHHFDKKAEFALEALRVLKPGGILYIADPRFPWIIRSAMNGVLRLIRVVGEFYTIDEMESRFAEMGFICMGSAVDSYAQVVKFRKNVS